MERNKNNPKDNNKQIGEMKGLLRHGAQAGVGLLYTGTLRLSLSPLFFFTRQKWEDNNPQNRASVCMFVRVLEKEKKKKNKARALCGEKCSERIDRVYYSEQHSLTVAL